MILALLLATANWCAAQTDPGNGTWKLRIAGEARLRYEMLDQPGFGRGPEDTNGYLLQRYLLSSDAQIGPHFRIFAQLQSALSNGRTGGPRLTDVNRLDVGQAYVDIAGRGLTLRIGRQEVGFGTGHLISPAEGLNVRRAFDGLRLTWERQGWTYNAVTLKLTDARPGIFNDVPDHKRLFWGVGAIGPHPLWNRAQISFYYLGLDRKDAVFTAGVGRQIRHTFGSRSWRNHGPWDGSYEAIVQWGEFQSRPVRAWALASETGYTYHPLRFAPRLGLRANLISGNRARGGLNTFDPLFPSAIAYSGSSGLLGPVNLMDVTPAVRLKLLRSVSILADAPFYWRQSLADGIYTAFGTPLRSGTANQARFVGVAPAISVTVTLVRHASLTALYSHFATGGFFRVAQPNRSVNYVGLAMTWTL